MTIGYLLVDLCFPLLLLVKRQIVELTHPFLVGSFKDAESISESQWSNRTPYSYTTAHGNLGADKHPKHTTPARQFPF